MAEAQEISRPGTDFYAFFCIFFIAVLCYNVHIVSAVCGREQSVQEKGSVFP